MISHLDGIVTSVAPDGAVVDVGGVGLLVQCTPAALAGLRPGERSRVATSLVVREDALTLYGFTSEDERLTFELLQTASGVGPRLALAVLSVLSPDELRRAVASEDLTSLIRVPGVGRKGAQRIVLELAGRLGPPDAAGLPGTAAAGRSPLPLWRDQVRAGLVSLGWSARDADAAIDEVVGADGSADRSADRSADGDVAGADGSADVDVAAALRAALRVLGRRP